MSASWRTGRAAGVEGRVGGKESMRSQRKGDGTHQVRAFRLLLFVCYTVCREPCHALSYLVLSTILGERYY